MPEGISPAGGQGLPQPRPTQQPPMGVSSATQPTPNKGFDAAAAQRVSLALNILTEVMSMAGATSDIGMAANKAIGILAKAVPPGTSSPASQRNAIDQLQQKNMQNQATMQQMQKGGGQGGGMPPGGAPPGGPPGGGMQAAA